MLLEGVYKDSKKQIKLLKKQGVNLIGYSRAEMGIGESCRIAARGIDAANIPFGVISYKGTSGARMSDLSLVNKEISGPIYDINIFHINAEQMPEVYAQFNGSLFQGRYNIAVWHWELPEFPDDWRESFKLVDEVWAPSSFVYDSISKKSPVPVVKIPHSIDVIINELRDRDYFNLPNDPFLFLTMYDVNSFQERKNPRAAIEAFKRAFKPDDFSVGLVIKVNSYSSKTNESQFLSELISNYKNIYLIEEMLTRNDTNSLISVTNAFISLHRSEGFGLGLAEAMYLGKPAIGTNWSSTVDFMNYQNSCIVDYKLIELGRDYGPYKAHQYWADPDIGHASYYMKKLVEDEEYYKLIALNGERYIKKHFSPDAIGEMISERLKYIQLWNAGG